MPGSSTGSKLGQFVSDIVAAYVRHHRVDVVDLPSLIHSVYWTIHRLSCAQVQHKTQVLEPAVPIESSVFPDYLICLEDGEKRKMLKRHLKTVYDMEPHEYRAKWGLPAEYPLVAPNYSRQRSTLAKQMRGDV